MLRIDCIMKIKVYQGFTLIELLIALTIFAILAAITSGTLYHAFNVKEKMLYAARQLESLQMTLVLLEKTLNQVTPRAVYNDDMRYSPPFVGHSDYLEFTHGGAQNPQSIEKRSTLIRAALICKNKGLYQRSWDALGAIEYRHFHEKLLISGLTHCQFAYLNGTLQVLSEWRENAMTQGKLELLPKAVQLTLAFNNTDTIKYLFILPKGLYDPLVSPA